MSEIRTFMDDVNNQYEKRKRYNQRMIYYKQLQAEKNALRAAKASGVVNDASDNSIVSKENSTIKKNEYANTVHEKQ